VNRVDILEAVKITNNRVKPFDGKKRYLATGNLSNQGIDNFLFVDYENKPSRADLMVSEGDLILARMKETNKVFLIDCDSEKKLIKFF
jgi:type I restriction enzyme S subunit